MAFAYKGTFTVTASASLLPSTQTDLPVLVYVVDNSLKAVGSGGQVQNTCSFNGQTVPADVVFKLASNLSGAAMSFDIEYWDGTSGTLIAWVRKSSCALGDIFYCGIGDAAITTYQGGSVGAAYHSGVLAAWHLADGTTINLNDATANGFTLTNHASWGAAAGKIGGGTALANGTSQYFSNASIATPNTIMVSFWQNIATADLVGDAVIYFTGGSGGTQRLLSHAPFSDKNLYWDYGDATGGQGRVSTDYTSFLDAWAHVTLLYDSATGIHAVYLAGALAVTNTHSTSNPTLTGLNLNVYAPDIPGSDVYGKRKLDEVRIYNAVPSSVADWVKADSYQYPSSGFLSSSFAALTVTDGQEWMSRSTVQRPRRVFQVGY